MRHHTQPAQSRYIDKFYPPYKSSKHAMGWGYRIPHIQTSLRIDALTVADRKLSKYLHIIRWSSFHWWPYCGPLRDNVCRKEKLLRINQLFSPRVYLPCRRLYAFVWYLFQICFNSKRIQRVNGNSVDFRGRNSLVKWGETFLFTLGGHISDDETSYRIICISTLLFWLSVLVYYTKTTCFN